MKKILASILLIFTLLIAYSQAIRVFEKGKYNSLVLPHTEIDSITTQLTDTISQHLFYTKDSLYTYDATNIDSIVFNLSYIDPKSYEINLPKYNPTKFYITVNHGKDKWELTKADNSGDWLIGLNFSYGDMERSAYGGFIQEDIIDDSRTTEAYFITDHGTDTIKITQFNRDAFDNNTYPFFNDHFPQTTHTWQKRIHEIKANDPFIFSGLEFYSINGGAIFPECEWIRYTISDDKKTLYLEIDENPDTTERLIGIIPYLYPRIRYNNTSITQHKAGVATPEMQKQALIDLYNSMGGANWENNENWLSDRPLCEWGDLTVGMSEDVRTINITNASGNFPPSLSAVMDVAEDITITGTFDPNVTHSLQGAKIPKEITQHPRWDELGWNILVSNRQAGFGINVDSINLRVNDASVMFPDSTTSTIYEVLSRNKYTMIAISTPSDEMANVYLSYCNKGFGYVNAAQDWLGGTIEEARQTAKNYPLNIIHTYKSFQLPGMGQLGSTYILDSIGNVIDFEGHIFDYPDNATQNSYYANRVDSILHKLLGEPEPHDPFVTTYYTSTDYSKDGEVLTLQKATVGNGIDLVLMGDAYDDRDMGEGGLYETDMRKSMEHFFNVEPYKSFRDRFNVYAVKVVSPNSHIGDGCTQAINYSDEVCFNYASKIEGIDLDQVTVANVINNLNLFYVSGYTNMYESGASVAHIEQGGPSSIIVHEAGGHGFAKLLDEYIYSGYEDNYCPPENLEAFKQWIKTDYHDRGWGVNVDATNAPDSVVWKHFLQDPIYANEVGIYQGAWYWPTDLWRASENSVMNNDYSYFNAPSREAIYKRIMQLSEGDDWVYDYDKFVEWDSINTQEQEEEPETGANVWTFYYEDTNWGDATVYAYVWDGESGSEYLGSWAGKAMTKNADGLWEISFSTDDTLVNPMVIFSNGNSGGGTNQTADFTLTNNGVYNYNGYVRDYEPTVVLNSISAKSKQTVMRKTVNHRIPTIIKGSPLNPQGVVPLPDFMNK